MTLEWVMHVKNYKLTLDKNFCVSCQICNLACPKEAITINKKLIDNEKNGKNIIDINLEKCNFCGICNIICPFGAIKLSKNGENSISVIEKNSFPQLIRKIEINSLCCPKECDDCKDACPLSLISISKKSYSGKIVSDIKNMSISEKKRVKIEINVKKEYCPTCRVCEFKCAPGVIKVKKIIEGKIVINQKNCPKGCKECVDACPIPEAIFISEDSKKVNVNELFCVYCGACKVVCPEENALLLKRTKIYHAPTRSGAWNKALERLTSQVDAVKEFKAKGSLKAKEMVSRKVAFDEVIR